MNKLEIISQLGDMKEVEYKNTLAITSIIELLVEKNIISREDIARKAAELDEQAYYEAVSSKIARLF
ncbi:MAG TPA: hypothetical protein PK830_03205 [Candidatus Atribacteria bacterium]|nr:hypothetical protein [Candidatus Atribacteria bacterium]